MNGKPRDMDYKFAIKVLAGAKVVTNANNNQKTYNQSYYDIAKNMAIQALKEKYEKTDTGDCDHCFHYRVCKYGENRMNGGYCSGERCAQYAKSAELDRRDKNNV